MTPRIRAEYVLRTAVDPERAAAVIAGEQSSGTFVRLAGETEALQARAAARVERLEALEDDGAPPLPGALRDATPGARSDARSDAPSDAQSDPRSTSRSGRGLTRWRMTLSWPLDTVGASLPNLVATVAGNLFELREAAGLKLIDLDLPRAFLDRYGGPPFGVEGTRRLTGVAEGPVIGTIIKPSVGLDPQGTAEAVAALAAGGVDFIKDDELQADGPLCPFDARLEAVARVLDRHEARTGKRVMYAVNLTGETDEMAARAERVAALGGTCVMVGLNSVGLAGFTALRRASRLPIHAHRNGWGYLGRSPDNGWAYGAWSKLWRIAGADHMHVNGLANKFWEADGSVIASARGCLAPLFEDAPARSMPVFSSGQTVRQAHETLARLGSADLIHAAGGGIAGHPDGLSAGVEAMRAAWQAAAQAEPLEEAARRHRPLARALEVFA